MLSRGAQGSLFLTAVVVALVAACGQSPPAAGSSSAGSSSAASAAVGSPTEGSAAAGSTTVGSAAADGLGWVPWGPSDPTTPVPGDWPNYNLLAGRDATQPRCKELEQSSGDSELWQAAGAVCAAAVDGEQDQWEVAAREFAAAGSVHLDTTPPSGRCLDDLVRGLIQRALSWHRNHPDRRPVVTVVKVADNTECGRLESPPANPASDTGSAGSSGSSSDTGSSSSLGLPTGSTG